MTNKTKFDEVSLVVPVKNNQQKQVKKSKKPTTKKTIKNKNNKQKYLDMSSLHLSSSATKSAMELASKLDKFSSISDGAKKLNLNKWVSS